MATHKTFKKWLVLSAVATALTLIPRRSSRKADTKIPDKDRSEANGQNSSHDDTNAN